MADSTDKPGANSVSDSDASRTRLRAGELRLTEVPLNQSVELIRIDLPQEQMERLLEIGVLPGCRLCPIRRSPFGDPILDVEGSVIAVRKEVAACLCVRNAGPDPN